MNVHDERKSVAVIGAGISGLMSARYLHLTGLNVTVFERSGSLGGVWSVLNLLGSSVDLMPLQVVR